MKQIVPDVFAKCENIVGIQANEWYIKNIRTKWGTCNVEKTYLVEFSVGQKDTRVFGVCYHT